MNLLLAIISILVFISAAFSIFALVLFKTSFERLTPDDLEKTRKRVLQSMKSGKLADKSSKITNGIAWSKCQVYEDIWISSFDGLKLHAKFLYNPAQIEKTIILSHGYHSSPEFDFSCALPMYYELGYNLLLIDQRAHGQSEGKYICFGVRERFDILKWCQHISLKFGNKHQIIIGGISMGATAALLAAALPDMPKNLIGVIADCGFTSPYAEFVHILKDSMHIPLFPTLYLAELIAKNRAGFTFRECSTVDAVQNIKVPVLFIHGEGDTFVLPENTIKNYNSCTSAKELILIPDAGHGLSFLADEILCTKKLKTFLNSL